MHLEHLGLAVRDAAPALDHLARVLGLSAYKTESVESEGVRTTFLDAGGPRLELLEATTPESPIARHLERRGEGLHHVAFEVDNLDEAFRELEAAGVRLLNDAPKPGADGKRIFFIHPKETAGVLVELCQSARYLPDPSFVPVGAERLAYYAEPVGPPDTPPVVVLHGALGCTELETARLLPELQPFARPIALDFAGHGRSSDFADVTFSMERFAEDVIALLDHLGLEQADLFGFSMGGAVALYVAYRYPERVRRMAVHGVNVQWDEREARVMTAGMNPEAMAQRHPRWANRLRAVHGEDRWQPLAERLIDFTDALPQRHFEDDALAQIETPTLVSMGDSDRYFRLEHAISLYRTLPHARLAVLPGLDHPIQGVDPRSFGRMVGQWLCSEER